MKLKGPLFSVGAHGKLANDLSFSQRKGTSIGRSFHYPKTIPSGLQVGRRFLLGMLNAHWGILSAADQAAYGALGAALPERISGYNYFIKSAYADLLGVHGLLSFWPMTEASGLTVTDLGPAGANATITQAGTPGKPRFTKPMVKTFRKSLENALGGGRVSVIFNEAIQPTSNFTIIAEVDCQGIGGNGPGIISRWISTGNNKNFYFRISKDDGPEIGISVDGTSNPGQYNQTWANTFGMIGKKGSLAVVFEPSTYLNLYFNGVLIKENTTAIISGVNLGNLATYIATWSTDPAGAKWIGKLNFIRVYNRTMTQPELLAQSKIMKTGKERQFKLPGSSRT